MAANSVFTTNIKIGNHVFVNLGATIGHDTIIEDGCVLNPGSNISGGVLIKAGTLIGTNATILQYNNIGAGVIVGAGAVVTKDVQDNTTVIGVPAKPINKKLFRKIIDQCWKILKFLRIRQFGTY